MASSTGSDSTSVSQRELTEDLTLLKRIASGNRHALSEFYYRYIDAIYRFVYHQVGMHEQDAEDVTQETFIAAIDNLESFRGESRLYVWLCGIAWRKASDFRRRRDHRVTPQTLPQSELVRLRESVQDFPPVEDTVDREHRREMVWQVLSTLPEHYQQVLILKYMEEFKVAEIALIVGKSEKAVESLLGRARHAFQAALDKQK